ncbi:hypothetical protein ACLEDP_12725 [Lonsdalea quercina]|uniref:hypothetical protein n=1 Tax=Lonsdalea quercina TaxID=71657 RepID=UPI00397490B9
MPRQIDGPHLPTRQKIRLRLMPVRPTCPYRNVSSLSVSQYYWETKGNLLVVPAIALASADPKDRRLRRRGDDNGIISMTLCGMSEMAAAGSFIEIDKSLAESGYSTGVHIGRTVVFYL